MIPKSLKINTHFGTENEPKLKNKLSLIALNHVTSEQNQRRFKLSKDLYFVENFLRNNLPSDIFLRIKEIAVRSFTMISICQRFVWSTSSTDFCLRSSRIRIFFILVFVWVLPLTICHLNLSVVNKRQFCRRDLDSIFQHQFLILI